MAKNGLESMSRDDRFGRLPTMKTKTIALGAVYAALYSALSRRAYAACVHARKVNVANDLPWENIPNERTKNTHP